MEIDSRKLLSSHMALVKIFVSAGIGTEILATCFSDTSMHIHILYLLFVVVCV